MGPSRKLVMVVSVAVLALGSVSSADEKKKSDPKGDTRGAPQKAAFDIRSASVTHGGTGHGGADVMVHRVVSWTEAGYRSVVLDLKTGEDKWSATVMKKPGRPAAIYNFHSGERIGPAKYKKTSDRSFTLTFSTGEFGHPDRYAWRWRVIAEGHTEFRAKSFDKLPNKGKIWHDLFVH